MLLKLSSNRPLMHLKFGCAFYKRKKYKMRVKYKNMVVRKCYTYMILSSLLYDCPFALFFDTKNGC